VANGPTAFSGTIRETINSGPPGRFELAGVGTCASNTIVDLTGLGFVIRPSGVLDLGGATEFRMGFTSLINEGTLEKTLPGNLRVRTGLENRNSVRIINGGIAFEGGAVVQTAGLMSLQTTGLVIRAQANQGPSGLLDLRGGRLEGNAVIFCGFVTNAAVISPGLPVGKLDLQVGTHPVLSLYQQTEAGRLIMDIGGPEPGVSHDWIHVTGRAALAGTLELKVAPGYDPPIGETYLVLTTGRAIEGTFGAVLGASLSGNKRLAVDYSANTVTIRVAAGP
jgi:hypothetical protein